MRKNIEIRYEALNAIKKALAGEGILNVTFHDGRPGFIDAKELPAVAVYITDAESSEEFSTLCGPPTWKAILHIEVFLKADSPDTALDHLTDKAYTAVTESHHLNELLITMAPQGYDYQRDEEVMSWGSADLRMEIQYNL